ncbi:right-handed parallel beta-helix repeat-containing protein [Paenibacillus sp. MMS20-IR301]|uniref:right-handed parallel beta-helix repeat-containing protein n=1 Tax=Paenibacillus sp. MMS20-IR301 TaxID=2895946 RepID=UPI0028E1D148|nr:right-handed parallel beta-helix repeat-containing protein [Paenibacillus sp. MMS20-IR301]WNS46310.1 right-handed parallel beta-helix repeat-containing protein [Paenibacillus sp. MMS20-IR301]
MAMLESVNNSIVYTGLIVALLLLFAAGLYIRLKRNKRKKATETKLQAELTKPVFIRTVQRITGEELERRIPQQQVKLPDQLTFYPAEELMKNTAERLALMLERFEELKEYRSKLQLLADDAVKPLLLAVMGLFKSGKSSFINELIGIKDFLRTDDVPATAVVTMLSYGETREVIAHLLDGSAQSYPYDKLHALSAEGDEGTAAFRASIDYLEVRLPVDLLRKVTIVDTPGLNSDNEHHTRATERFAERADQVLWLFSYGQAGSRQEMSRLSRMSGGWKPIGVVNCIDEHDPEEGELPAFLQQVRRRLGSSISRLEAVSTLQACEGRITGDVELQNRSGWHQLEQALQDELYGKSAMKKTARHLSRLHSLISALHKDIHEQNKKYEEACLLAGDKSQMIQTLNNNRKKVQQLLNEFNALNKETALHNLEELHPLPGTVSDSQKLNKQMKMLIAVLKELEAEHNSIEKSFRINDQYINDHNIAHRRLENDYGEYNKSGMFGGKPLLDWDGKLKALNARSAEMDKKAEELNANRREILSQQKLFLDRLNRNEQEGFELVQLIVDKLKHSIAEFDKLLDNHEETQAEAERMQQELAWTAAAKSMLSHLMSGEVSVFGAVLQQTIALGGDVQITGEQLEPSLAYLQKLEQRLLESLDSPQAMEAAVSDIEPSLPAAASLLVLISEAEENAELQLEPACYVLSETLVVTKSLTIRGSDTGNTVITGNLEALLRLTAMKELSIENVQFELSGTAGNIAVIESGHALFKHCSFKDAAVPVNSADALFQGAGLLLLGDSKAEAENCRFIHNAVGAAALDESRLLIRSSVFHSHQRAGIIALGQGTVELHNSELTYNLTGLHLAESAKGSCTHSRLCFCGDGLYAGGNAELIAEENNIAFNERDGIRGEGQAVLTAVANDCQMNLDGIHLLDSAGGYLAANRCNRNLSAGINYETEHEVTLEHNQCNLNGSAGIAQYAARAAAVIRNECSGNLMHGIYAAGAGSHELEGNNCRDNHESGMALGGTVTVWVTYGNCSNNQNGLFVSEQAQAVLQDGHYSHNLYGGIYAKQAAKVTVTGCESNSNSAGIAISGEAQAAIKHCSADGNRYNGIVFGDQSSGSVEHSTCKRNGEAGISAREHTRVELYSNTSKDNKLFGIYMYDEAKGTTAKNLCSANELGIYLAGRTSFILRENECFMNKGSGICYIERASGTAVSNNCHDNGMDGIFITGESTPVLEKNIAVSNSNSGISVDGRAAPELNANVLQRNAGYGLQLGREAIPKLSGNQFQGNKLGDSSGNSGEKSA